MPVENSGRRTIPAMLVLALLLSCFRNHPDPGPTGEPAMPLPLITGASRTEFYLPMILGKSVGVVANHSSRIDDAHLVDSLGSLGVKITRIFSPEHGFQGTGEAGETIRDGRDASSGIPVVSLYGHKVKPLPEDMKGIDVMIFDIQDVGVRFFTYISSMTYVMEACAENGIPLIIMDRPNPNGDYMDGPVLSPEFKSFVGLHPVPVVYGMTIGEYAGMVNGEGWLEEGLTCELTVIPMDHYRRDSVFPLPVRPSPNLPRMEAIRLYPSLCFFEGTIISVGRGTDAPFMMIGHPEYEGGDTSFTPRDMPGMATDPPYKGMECRGYSLILFARQNLLKESSIILSWLIDLNRYFAGRKEFFTGYFDLLAGDSLLKKQISAGVPEEEIRLSWKNDHDTFRRIRKKYLLYPDTNEK